MGARHCSVPGQPAGGHQDAHGCLSLAPPPLIPALHLTPAVFLCKLPLSQDLLTLTLTQTQTQTQT